MNKSITLVLTFLMSSTLFSQENFTTEFNFEIEFFSGHCESEYRYITNYDYYTILTRNDSCHQDSTLMRDFITDLTKKIRSEGTKVYSYDQGATLAKSDDADYWYYKGWYNYNQNGEQNKNRTDSLVDYSNTSEIRFVQEWSFDNSNNKLNVNNLMVCPIFSSIDDAGNFRGISPMYYHRLKEATSLDKSNQIIGNKNIIWSSKLEVQLPLKSRKLIRNHEKPAFPIQVLFNAQLNKILHNKIVKGEIQAFIPNTDSIYELPKIKNALFCSIDTVFQEGDDGEYIPVAIPYFFNQEEMAPLKIYQEFYFNHKNLTVTSKITKVILSYNNYNAMGDVVSSKPIFEIRYE